MKVAVIGSNGQLGSDVRDTLLAMGHEVVGLTHGDVEISDIDSGAKALREVKPNIVVNTAAMHNVEKCEQNPAEAFAVNACGARNLAHICNELDSVLIHISTDYVFDGRNDKPYIERDVPIPLNVYGNSKLSGENFIRSISKRFFILRVSAIYGVNPCRAKGGLNFVELMLKLAKEKPEVRVVNTEFISPTFTRQISLQVAKLISFDGYGLYHATAEEFCSWYEFAKEIFLSAHIHTPLKVANPNDFPAKVPRPVFSVLENKGLNDQGLNCFSSWREGLRQYFVMRPQNSISV